LDAQSTYDHLVIEENHDLEEDMPLSPLSPPQSAPVAVDREGSLTTPSIEIDIQENEAQSALDQESAITNEFEVANQTQESISPDFEEEEVSLQLAHPPSSPTHSPNVLVDKNMVLTHPDRESSPQVEVPEHVPELVKTPVPDIDTEIPQTGLPDSIQDVEEEPPTEKPADIEVKEESTSRKCLETCHVQITHLCAPGVGSEEPLSMAAQRSAKEQEPQDSSMEDVASPQQGAPEYSTVGDVSQETPPFERSPESPKLSGAELGVQTRRGKYTHANRPKKLLTFFTGKRKAEFEAELKREKKKMREESETAEEEEHGTCCILCLPCYSM
jgi:hypothetical protein